MPGADARLFVLGSLPGDASLAAQRYYAHPTNQFWRLLGAAIGEELQALGYDERLARLAERRIGLWDVIASASRRGSLDQAIRDGRAQSDRASAARLSRSAGDRVQWRDGRGGGRKLIGDPPADVDADRPAVIERGQYPAVRGKGRRLVRAWPICRAVGAFRLRGA